MRLTPEQLGERVRALKAYRAARLRYQQWVDWKEHGRGWTSSRFKQGESVIHFNPPEHLKARWDREMRVWLAGRMEEARNQCIALGIDMDGEEY